MSGVRSAASRNSLVVAYMYCKTNTGVPGVYKNIKCLHESTENVYKYYYRLSESDYSRLLHKLVLYKKEVGWIFSIHYGAGTGNPCRLLIHPHLLGIVIQVLALGRKML